MCHRGNTAYSRPMTMVVHSGGNAAALWSATHWDGAGSVTMSTRPPMAHFQRLIK